ncbi:Flagellar hook-length control protein [Plesiomonas shigelloides]|uniref:flagellar hook-length control protein FliK n=1 Tax=Plesiomonas shigelloides TaxID=703 RepID=UPI000D9AB863|nr:flagellar hook-length control protein FliK [Plesiomonas shigelloides]SPZ43923.1 Flagellar hook-length control protein [Plesiomonas shigelloides]
MQLTQLTSAPSSASRTGASSATGSSVQPATNKADGHSFSQSLNGSNSAHDQRPTGAADNKTESKTDSRDGIKSAQYADTETHAHAGAPSKDAGKEDKAASESAQSTATTGQADLAQQIAYLLQTQQALDPQTLRQGFANGASEMPLTAVLTGLAGNNLLRGNGKSESLVHDIPAPADQRASNVDSTRPAVAAAATAIPLTEGDLSALASAMSDKNVTAPVVAMSQQGLNAITAKSPTAMAASAQPSAADAMNTPSPTLALDINKPQWGDALIEQLRQRIQVQAGNKLQHAQIRLDPPELGKLDISLRMDGDKLSVQFTAAHPQLREALLAGSDRLRQDFSQTQMNLIDVSVSGGQPQQGRQGQQEAAGHEGPVIRRATSQSTIPALSLPRQRAGFDSLV